MANMQTFKTSQIFGSFGKTSPGYVHREDLSSDLAIAAGSGQHIVLFGDAGQGKTTLLREVMGDGHYLIQCAAKQAIPDLYRTILFEAGASVTTQRRLTKKSSLSATVKLFDTGGGGSREEHSEASESFVTIDLGNISDVLRVLERAAAGRWVILNDVQLLRYSAQRELAKDLKYVAENSELRFVLVGTWSGAARFLDLNSDAAGYVRQVFVRPWSHDELETFIRNSEALVNVVISPALRSRLIRWSTGCIRTMHSLMHEVCRLACVNETSPRPQRLEQPSLYRSAVRTVFARSFEKYRDVIREFTDLPVMYLDENAVKRARASAAADAEASETGEGGDAEDDSGSDGRGESPVEALERHISQKQAAIELDNSKSRMKALGRRAFIEFLVRQDWAVLTERLTMRQFEDFAQSRYEELRQAETRHFEKVVRKFLKVQDKADVSPDLIQYDKIDHSIRIVDQKFRIFLSTSSPASVRRLFAQSSEPVTPDSAYW